ncbi:MAG: serine/threonine-protein phosphatase [Planctomycetaceae bacterium]|nr:serine/threonine-protein phosphatase [Planctomycetaceae bacterium]
MPSRYLPLWIVLAICLATTIPSLFGLAGWRLDLSEEFAVPKRVGEIYAPEEISPRLLAYYQLAGPFTHTVLEWTACCVAIVTGMFSFVHYRLKRDVTTPIIGTALLLSGMLDGFNILAADRLTFPVKQLNDFVPFTWAVSRIFNVAILLAGTLPFVLRPKQTRRRTQAHQLRSVLLFGLLFGLMAYGIIHLYSRKFEIPEALFADARIPRPWDLIPLILWLLAGLLVLPRFWKLQPSLFAHALIVSAFPAIATQMHMAFASTALFDHHFFCGYLLKILTYSVPLVGLILDYGNAHRSELALRETEIKLDAARQIAMSLLPTGEQHLDGLEVGGFSYASEAVGGDYYDFLRLSRGRFGVVVGDVSGHDLAASILASQTRAYLRAYADSLDDLSDVFTRLNNALVVDTQQRRFVTMFCAVISADRNSLVYAAAGHQGFLLRQSGDVETLDSNFLPLGMTDQGKVEVTDLAGLRPGDSLLIVTDGITEALSPEGEQYGLTRLLEFLRQESARPVPDLVQRLQQNVNEFCTGIPPSDDVTVVLVRWKLSPPQV